MPYTPSIATIYGPSKTGKTVQCIATFPRGYFIAKPQALECAAVLGIKLHPAQIGTATTLEEMITIVRRIGATPGKPFDGLIGDDLSIVVDQTVLKLEPTCVTKSGGVDGRRLWGTVRKLFLELRIACEEAGLYAVFNAHEKGPLYYGGDDEEVKQGNAVVGKLNRRGGPQLPGRMPEDLPAICNQVFRVEVQPPNSKLLAPGYWPAAIRFNTSDPYIVGDRSDVAFDGAPLNFRELIREAARRKSIASGNTVDADYGIGRWPGLEWQEAAVVECAVIFAREGFGATSAVDWNSLITNAENYVRSKWRVGNERHVRWAVADALAAGQFQWKYTQSATRYGIVNATARVGFGGA